MANLMTTLKQEIRRLGRSEARQETAVLKRSSAQYRRDIAALKRQVAQLTKKIAFLEKRERQRIGQPATAAAAEQTVQVLRFSPAWLRKHRAKLGLSAQDYGKLAGVSAQSIYHWEQEKSRPRKAQVAALAALRGLGKREAMQQLEVLASQAATKPTAMLATPYCSTITGPLSSAL